MTDLSIEYGNIIHEIFERIETIKDIPIAVQSLTDEGKLDSNSASDYIEKVKSYIQIEELKEFFSGEGLILREKSLLVPGKGELRPDRVVIFNKRAVVLDYKTGKAKARHKSQVRQYMRALSIMGYHPVEGFLLYFDDRSIIRV